MAFYLITELPVFRCFILLIADHHWPLMENGRDEFQLHDLLPGNQDSFSGIDFVIDENNGAQARSYDIDEDHCLNKPENCNNGMAVQFSLSGKLFQMFWNKSNFYIS